MNHEKNTDRKTHEISLDFSGCLAEKIGETHGIDENDLRLVKQKCEPVLNNVNRMISSGTLGFHNLVADTSHIAEIQNLAAKFDGKYKNILVFGIGGSALGVTMLFEALCSPFHNELVFAGKSNSPTLFVFDNVDPTRMAAAKKLIHADDSLVILITKSGGTIETWGNFYYFLNEIHGNLKAKQIVAITDPEKGYLRQTAREKKWATLPIPENVGGRFSVLTSVGLFPAALLGIDISQLLSGAHSMQSRCATTDFNENPALQLAAIHYYLAQFKSKPISVMMPYSDALASFADWYRQLWAESLGKRLDRDGREVFCGQTPVKALGATDQHSQIQLYREGPNDKIITFLRVDRFRRDGGFHRSIQDTPFNDLTFLNVTELLNSEMEGTREALTDSQRPNIQIRLPEINPFVLGELIYLYEMATCFSGEFLNINAFDQPGVEAGKVIAKEKIRALNAKRTR